MDPIDTRLSAEFERNAEWKAYQARVARILTKRNGGHALTKGETIALSDYKMAMAMTAPPKHALTGTELPPTLSSYTEAGEAFGLHRQQIYQLRTEGCEAFVGNTIYVATLAAAIKASPAPAMAAINAVHTGRKGKLTPEIQAGIVAMLATCPVLITVAGAHGLDGSTLSVWRKKGEDGDKKYADFFRATEEALEMARARLVAKIVTDPDWRAALSILERTQPETWGRRQAIEHTGAGGKDLPIGAGPSVTFVLTGLPEGADNPFDPASRPAGPDADAGA